VYAAEESDGYVDPDWRGHGIGAWLVRWRVERAGMHVERRYDRPLHRDRRA
jgi:GNAT superfamily N-acetyltransferase